MTGRLIHSQALTANPALARILGYAAPEELVGAIDVIGRQVHVDPGRHDELRRRMAEHGAVTRLETELVRQDGSRIWVSVSMRAVRDPVTGTLHYDGTVEDITERKRLEEQVRHAQKMEAIGQLAGGVAHDFNNILTVILNYCQLMLKRLIPGHPMRHEVTIVRTAAERAASLTRQLLVFGRKESRQPISLDLDEVVTASESMLGRLIGEDYTLIKELEPALWSIVADVGQIEQVIMNLVVNARDAMPDGGVITIATRNLERTEPAVVGGCSVAPGRYVELSVADAGCGMDEATRARIFEPFFTTKEVGRGTGLGLSMVYAIVEQNEGHIEVTSEPGGGSVFTISLPAASAAGPAEVAETGGAVDHGLTSGTVLLVEDDPAVRELVRRVLEEAGVHVLDAGDGAAALEVSRSYDGPIHLMLSDVIMPGMTSNELARWLLVERPGTEILYMTGYADRSVPGGRSRPAPATTLLKPFSEGDLIARVRAALDKAR